MVPGMPCFIIAGGQEALRPRSLSTNPFDLPEELRDKRAQLFV